MNVTKQLQTKISIDDNHDNIQILRKMGLRGLLKVLTKIWLGQDLAKDKKYSQLQAFDALKLQDKVKAFDTMTPEDKLEVLDELFVFYEQLKRDNLDYFYDYELLEFYEQLKNVNSEDFSVEDEEKAIRLFRESIFKFQFSHINSYSYVL